MIAGAGAGEHDGESEGGEHEQCGSVAGHLGEEVGCSAGTECGLGALSAERAGEVGGFAGLEENDADEEEADDDVTDDEEVEKEGHDEAFATFARCRNVRLDPMYSLSLQGPKANTGILAAPE